MFDETKTQSLSPTSQPAAINWASMPVDYILQCYDQIREHLPPLALKDMNLEEEMLLQLHNVRALQTLVLNDEDIALNQRVAAAKIVTDSLNKLAELQDRVYTSERFKAVENILIRHLMRLPEDTATAFLTDYQAYLDK